MNLEESAILRYAVNKVNDEICKGVFGARDSEQVDRTLFAAVEEAIGISDELAPGDHAWFHGEIEKGAEFAEK